ncbi:MAG TPA: glycoside hydrolase family 75 protein [Chitinivibrionales bacterium]|nr:glycoside hydrolase family 75 protein [Chitinivibrionales bacterium]
MAAAVEGNVDPKKLLNWVDSQKAVAANCVVKANGKDMNNGGTGFCTQCSNSSSQPVAQNKTISLFQTTGAVFFDADMDIDCDGSDNGVCGGTDPSHQNLLSCDANVKCSVDNGGPIDAAGTPFYVLPVGSPFDYASRGIAIGQLAAVINRKTNPVSIAYAPFLDEDGVSQEIGEASAAMAQLLGVPNDPNTGGQDTGLVYIVFRGPGARFTSVADMADHQKAISAGQALAAALIGSPAVIRPTEGAGRYAATDFRISNNSISITSSGRHALSVYSVNGKLIMEKSGTGCREYELVNLKCGLYFIRLHTLAGSFQTKFIRY